MNLRALSAVCFLTLSACAQERALPLRIGANNWPGYGPLFLATETGLLSHHDAELVDLPSATEVMYGIKHGLLDGAALTLDESLTLLAEGTPVEVVAVLDVSDGADAIVAGQGIASPADLRGRTVGVETSALGTIMLLSALEANGLTMQDVRVRTLTVDDHLAAFQAGEVDALVTFEPVKSQAIAAGGTSIFDSRAIPGRIVDVLAVRSDVGASRPRAVGVLVDAWFAAQSAVARDPAGTAKVMAPRSWVSPDDYRAAVATIRFPDREENRRLLGGASPGLAAPARELAGLLVRGGRLPTEPSVEGLFGGPFVGAP